MGQINLEYTANCTLKCKSMLLHNFYLDMGNTIFLFERYIFPYNITLRKNKSISIFYSTLTLQNQAVLALS